MPMTNCVMLFHTSVNLEGVEFLPPTIRTPEIYRYGEKTNASSVVLPT